jgi:3-deoxy-D-manno-octulosonic-acid transferase
MTGSHRDFVSGGPTLMFSGFIAMFFAYSLLFTLGVLLMTPYYAWRYRKTSFLRESWRERWGFLPESFQQSRRESIWVHAVSVGETLAIAGLVQKLRRRHPEIDIFMSHVTPAGRETGERKLPELRGRFYLPLDWPGPVRRVLNRIRPALLIIMETEIWPNLLRTAHQAGAKVVLVNARLSDRSLRGYRLFRFFMRRVFDHVDAVFAQTPADAARFLEIGAPRERVFVMGNLKFDGQPQGNCEFADFLKQSVTRAERWPVWVAASTMAGEEEQVLIAWREICAQHPRALLILAPRHPARCDEVARLLREEGLEWIRRSALAKGIEELDRALRSPGILLLDTLGELASLFELADLVFIGGSLVPTGGHNLLEPARWGKPVLFGPHMENFRDAAQILLQSKAAIQVRNAKELAQEMLRLLQNEGQRRALGEAARSVVERESGATERILERIAQLLNSVPSAPCLGSGSVQG